MASVNQCDQCGKVQPEEFNVLLTLVHERIERRVESLFALPGQSVTASDFEFCSFECAAMACHLMSVQTVGVDD